MGSRSMKLKRTLVFTGHKKTELLIYLALFAVLFAAPAVSEWIETSSLNHEHFNWCGICKGWRLLAVFFAVFCVHNFFIAPQLVYRNRKWRYILSTLVLVVAFTAFQIHQIGPPPHHHDGNPHHHAVAEDPRHAPGGEPGGDAPVMLFGGRTSVAFIIVCLLLALNTGTKYYFKSLNDRRRLDALERENLNTRLSYLKYQINPHFFMNTLNNIHAMVMIDPNQANGMIETLSSLMRYVLYDADKPLAPLRKEVGFIENFVSLMRVRYTDKVKIEVSRPEVLSEAHVPSLLFVTFVENAFKHGVSYARESFIDISFAEEGGNVLFSCTNSVAPATQKTGKEGGIGLDNARKRLRLIYGENYNLDITTTDTTYSVSLRLPAGAVADKTE
jgi:hypothetical protein